jgi:hypothetical protein
MSSRFGQEPSHGEPGGAKGRPLSFRLRYRDQELPLPRGTTVIGRGADAGVFVDDVAVSRRHAMLVVSEHSVLLEDLGSANGIYVNGARVLRQHYLSHGDHIMLGAQEMWLVATPESGFAPSAGPISGERSNLSGDEPTRVHGDLTLRTQMADTALMRRRGAEAERLLSGSLGKLLDETRRNGRVLPDTALRAARHAAKLATALRKGEWFDYVIELFSVEPLAMPSALVEELFLTLREVPSVNVAALAAFIEKLESAKQNLSTDELKGLEHLIMLQKLAALK